MVRHSNIAFLWWKGDEKARAVYITDSDVMYMVGETASNILPITLALSNKFWRWKYLFVYCMY
jgi:hypothetical protein